MVAPRSAIVLTPTRNQWTVAAGLDADPVPDFGPGEAASDPQGYLDPVNRLAGFLAYHLNPGSYRKWIGDGQPNTQGRWLATVGQFATADSHVRRLLRAWMSLHPEQVITKSNEGLVIESTHVDPELRFGLYSIAGIRVPIHDVRGPLQPAGTGSALYDAGDPTKWGPYSLPMAWTGMGFCGGKKQGLTTAEVGGCGPDPEHGLPGMPYAQVVAYAISDLHAVHPDVAPLLHPIPRGADQVLTVFARNPQPVKRASKRMDEPPSSALPLVLGAAAVAGLAGFAYWKGWF